MNISDLMLRCNRCRHKWLRRSAQRPKQCPACKTTFYDRERVRNIRRDRRAAKRG
jgi:hypothetical protein